MAMTLTEQLNTMYTTTWYNRLREIVDQIFDATPFFYLLKKKGKTGSQTGGRKIEIPLQYGKNETVQFIGKGGTVSISATDPLTVVQWDWKYLTGHIVRYFVDVQKNAGKAQIIKKVTADINNLQSSLVDHMEESLFGDGTGDSSRAIDGLANIVAEDPTASKTVGSINQSTYSWWRNQYKDMSSYPASIYLRKEMNKMFNNCGKKGKGISRFPDMIVCAQDVHEFYESEALEISRIHIDDKKLADLGFGDTAYKGRAMTWSPSCTSGSLYMLNSNFLEWVNDPIENFTLGEWLPILNQPRDVIAHAMNVGNLICGNRGRQGVMFDIAE